MKKLLIISPYFPPSNAPDMQRVRTSLPYFEEYGWIPEVVTVDEKFSDFAKDPLLLKSFPSNIKIHKVKALSKTFTSKFGLGSIALRSLYFYFKKVNTLLKNEKYDLIYFSTTQFPVCILGAYWKKKFNIPYVIDVQDPWHTDYYKDKPKYKRPKKYWFSYRLNKMLEPIAMKNVDGLISVSADYIKTLTTRYPILKTKPSKVITFGGFEKDFEIAANYASELKKSLFKPNFINLVYVGRAGHDMKKSLEILFNAFKKGLIENNELFKTVRFYFIGTSYAPVGKGEKTVEPIAKAIEVDQFVYEQTDRIPYYEGLKWLKESDGLIIIGSDLPDYTASKIFPYILAKKQLLAIFNAQSSATGIIRNCKAGILVNFKQDLQSAYSTFSDYITKIKQQELIETNWETFETFTAKSLTKAQVNLFNETLINTI